jgi:predicted RNA methylase
MVTKCHKKFLLTGLDFGVKFPAVPFFNFHGFQCLVVLENPPFGFINLKETDIVISEIFFSQSLF